MESDHLDQITGVPTSEMADLAAVSDDVRSHLFATDSLPFSDHMQSTILSLMDSLVTQCLGDCHDDWSVDGLITERLNRIFSQPGLIMFLLCRYWERQVIKAGKPDQSNQIQSVSPVSEEFTDNRHDNLAMMTIAANTRFVHNMDQLDITLNELPSELVHLLITAIANEGKGFAKDLASTNASHDEAQSHLILNAKLIESNFIDRFDYGMWRSRGALPFLLCLSRKLDLAFDNIILCTALQDPQIFMLVLRAAGIVSEDIILILAETPRAALWFSAPRFASYLKLRVVETDQETALRDILEWNFQQITNDIPYCGHWPWFGPS